MKRPRNAVECLDLTLADLARRERDAAARNKVTLWSYYGRVREDLIVGFAETEREDVAVRLTACRIIDTAVEQCPKASREVAARLWAMAVYARRIAGTMYSRRPSLAWLRERAGVQRPRVRRHTGEDFDA